VPPFGYKPTQLGLAETERHVSDETPHEDRIPMPMSRTILCLTVAGSIFFWAAGQAAGIAAQPTENPAGSEGAVANLKVQLQAGLKARLPGEFAFIDRVIAMVDQKQLPFDLVQSTFMWARVKKPYPFPYFENGLRTRAARQGIEI